MSPNASQPNSEASSQEERLQATLHAVRQSGLRPDGRTVLSLRQAAKVFHVPHATLTDRYNGLATRVKAHDTQQKLTVAQEEVLVEWVKEMGRRGIPLMPTTVLDYASDVTGKPVGQSWAKRFIARHPDIQVRWTRSLESSHARSMNPTLVKEFYDNLTSTINQYQIVPENIYNMDKKGIQLGIGKRVAALVDCDQKDVYHVEDGNRELVMVIETVCVDGTALHPSVIFQGQRRNLEWGRDNPCNASILHSPKGWTDQELGTKWLECDFEPATAACNSTDGYRLLILDGHNSHCTYCFCKFAADHRIIVLCLPSHTMHWLQPCDIGVFGPLASCWKAEVNEAGRQYIPIRKSNLLHYYHKARVCTFKPSTIKSSFTKTGIWPLNPSAIDKTAFKPSLNTTTEAAQPLLATLPPLLAFTETENSSHTSNSNSPPSHPPTTTHQTTSARSSASWEPSSEEEPTRLVIVSLPPPLSTNASRDELVAQNAQLRDLIEAARIQLQKDYALMKLMDGENKRLRGHLFVKDQNKAK